MKHDPSDTAGRPAPESQPDHPSAPADAPAAGAPREKRFLLAAVESRALEAMARRMPRWVSPDMLTGVGVLAAIGIGVSYALSRGGNEWLWVASALLVIHWLGDSLDGTLARVRRTERPTYGYYLDHFVDAMATVAIGLGLGLSPHMMLATGLVIVVAYLLVSINVYLETQAFGVFALGLGGVGPTEVRLALIALNTVIALGAGLQVGVLGAELSVVDIVGLGVAGAMVVGLLLRAGGNLRRLAVLEPPRRVRSA